MLQMALITDILLLALSIACATVAGNDALTEMEKDVEIVLNNQQQLFGQVSVIKAGLKALQEQYTCQLGECKIRGRLTLNIQAENKNVSFTTNFRLF